MKARKRFVSTEARDLAYVIGKETRYKATDLREVQDGTGDVYFEDTSKDIMLRPHELVSLGRAAVSVMPWDDSQVPGDQRPTFRFSWNWAEKNDLGANE
jgi:hypothetical protein